MGSNNMIVFFNEYVKSTSNVSIICLLSLSDRKEKVLMCYRDVFYLNLNLVKLPGSGKLKCVKSDNVVKQFKIKS